MKSREWSRLVAAAALVAAAPAAARAETYLSEGQAAALLLPGLKLRPDRRELTKEEAWLVEKTSGERLASRSVRVWWAPDGAAMIVDRAVGKHEFITYAVAVSSSGAVLGVEILDYRETYGHEVRGAEWRRQFVGKTADDPVRVGRDIRNISGATLSSVHVANGVRRVLATYAVLKPAA